MPQIEGIEIGLSVEQIQAIWDRPEWAEGGFYDQWFERLPMSDAELARRALAGDTMARTITRMSHRQRMWELTDQRDWVFEPAEAVQINRWQRRRTAAWRRGEELVP